MTLSIDSQQLSKSEQIALDHYKKKPEGRGFFAVAEILARHRQTDEAIQVLSKGLERHPTYSVARVFLAQLLMQRHFLPEAWTTLESSPIPLRGNLTAQIARLKLCVLLAYESQARAIIKELMTQDFHDSEIRLLIEQIDIKPFGQVRRDYADYMRIPQSTLPPDPSPPVEESPLIPLPPETALKAVSQETPMTESSFRERIAKGFFASPAIEIFSKPLTAPPPDELELDELTRGRLFRRQGFYQQAYEIYKRLLNAQPNNDLLRREFNEIRELRDSQREIDQQKDPALVESLEKVRKIDQKIKILNELLARLDESNYESPP